MVDIIQMKKSRKGIKIQIRKNKNTENTLEDFGEKGK